MNKDNPGDPISRGMTAWTAVILVALPAVMLLISAAKLHYPTAQWDAWALDAAEAIRRGTFADNAYLSHPPLYLYLLAWLQPLLPGGPLESARLLNFACYLLTGWLVYLLSGKLAGEADRRKAGLIGAALFFTSPLAAQGIFLLDLGDTGPIPVAAAAYFYLLFSRRGVPGFVLLSAAFALNLWAKLIHSLFMAAASLASMASSRKGERSLYGPGTMAAGFMVFLITWAVYAHFSLHPADRWGPLEYFLNEMLINYQRTDLASGPAALFSAKAAAVARGLLWLWPVLALWLLRVFRRGLGAGPERTANLYVLIFMIGAWVSKGASNGFPKYHMAILPVMCALCGSFAAELAGFMSGRAWLRAALLAAAAAACVYFAGDPLYTFNYLMKNAMISGSGLRAVLAGLALQSLIVPAALAGLLYLYGRRLEKGRAALFALSVSAFAWQAGMFGLQAGNGCFTTYGYGTSGKDQAVLYVRDNFRGGTVSGPNEFAWEFRAAGVPFRELSDRCFLQRTCVMAVIRDNGTSFFIFGQASNTVEQVRDFLSLDARSLGRPFTAVKKGDFWIYDMDRARAAGVRP